MKRTPIKRMSSKMATQKRKERELSKKLLERCGGLCERCGRPPDWRGLSKHEKVYRSQGGDPLDPDNTELICGFCHSEDHGVKEVRGNDG